VSDYADNLRKSMIHTTRRFMRMVQELKEKDDAALREQVIRMAQEAGATNVDAADPQCWAGDIAFEEEELERFFHAAYAAGAAAEREACAKVCEEHWHIDGEHTAYEFARVIRARGEK
jgi:hypothetical protein